MNNSIRRRRKRKTTSLPRFGPSSLALELGLMRMMMTSGVSFDEICNVLKEEEKKR